nr:MAG TPA: hypothetical protein [Crassvirales sp.]
MFLTSKHGFRDLTMILIKVMHLVTILIIMVYL